jgi:peptide/nickel transport system permease protein
MIAFFFVAINLVVDMLYYVVDPRLRVDAAKAHGNG